MQSERLRRSGIDASAVAALIAPVQVDEARLTRAARSAAARCPTFLTAYVVAFLTYLMTTLYGVAVMRSVLERRPTALPRCS